MTRALAAALAVLAACAGEGTIAFPPPVPCTAANAFRTTTVVMVADQMNPGCIQVSGGATVEFLNQDPIDHTATDQAAAPAFDLYVPAGTAAQTPPLAGPATVEVACTFHPAMRVTILVP